MESKTIRIRPLTPVIGAEIDGIDLNDDLPPAAYEEIRSALWRFQVIFFREQAVEPAAYLRLGEQFGKVDPGHEFVPSVEGFRQIQLLSHRGHFRPETDRWHADVTYRERPSLVSMLRLVHLPPLGGDTLWMSAGAAFEALPPPVQAMLLGLSAEHDLAWSHMATDVYGHLARRDAAAGRAPMSLQERRMRDLREHPAVVHPAVIAHPVTGRKTLFVNAVWTKLLVGLHPDLSDHILSMVFDWIKKPEFCVRFRWEPNSLVIWDNAATQHYAVFDYAPEFRAGQRLTCGEFTPAGAS